MLPFLPSRNREAKPVGEVVLDPANPLGRALAHAWVFSKGFGGTPNLIRPWEKTSGGDWRANDHGFALQALATEAINLNYTGRVPDPPFSLVVGFHNFSISAATTATIRSVFVNKPLANTASTSTIFTIEYRGATNNWQPGVTAATLSAVDTVANVITIQQHLQIDVVTGSSLCKLYRNDLTFVLSGTLSAIQAGNEPFYLGGWGSGVGDRNFTAEFDYFYIFKRQLTEGERLYLKKYPYSIVTPTVNRYPFGIPLAGRPAAGGTVFSDTITEIVTLGDAVTASATLTTVVTEIATLAEDLSVSVSITATLTESVVVTDDMSGGLAFTSTVTETVVLADDQSVSATLSTPITETVTGADIYSISATLTVAVTELVTLADELSGGLVFTATASETVVLSSTATSTISAAAADEVIGRKQFTRRRGKMGFYALFRATSQEDIPAVRPPKRETLIEGMTLAEIAMPKHIMNASQGRVKVDLSKLDVAIRRLEEQDEEDILLLMD